jgi:RelB antitoxin of RelBE toxin-antitoxin system
MPTIKKRYLVDKKNRRVGVVLDLGTFEKIEEILEDYMLGQIMLELEDEEPLSLEEAKKHYAKLKKRK